MWICTEWKQNDGSLSLEKYSLLVIEHRTSDVFRTVRNRVDITEGRRTID